MSEKPLSLQSTPVRLPVSSVVVLTALLLAPTAWAAPPVSSGASNAADATAAKDLPRAEPAEVGMSAERLARIGKHFQGYIDRGDAAGAAGMIARRGKIVWSEEWGHRDRETGEPMLEDTIHRIYSMSKPITSVALMTLYEEGRFALNDPVERYLPELADLEVWEEITDLETGKTTVKKGPAVRKPTILDLMRHTAGFSYGFFGDTEVDKAYRQAGLMFTDKDIKESIEKLGQMPLLFQPGTRWHYSVSVDVQGRLVEVISGQPFDEFLEDRLFKPLGMNDTSFIVPAAKLDRFAQLYAPKGTEYGNDAFLQQTQGKEIMPAPAASSRGFQEGATLFSGGGGLVSTSADYWRFCQMVLNGGELNGTRILSPKTVELMSRNHLSGMADVGSNGTASVFGRGGVGFGLGFSVITDINKTGEIGSNGTLSWGGAAGTGFFIDPEEELIGIFMVQILPHRTTMRQEFDQLVYQAIVE